MFSKDIGEKNWITGNKKEKSPVLYFVGEHRSHFEELFMPHLDAAYNLARWIVGRDQDAQDVVQEAYLRALKGLAGFRGSNARPWLMTIVRNTAYTWLKKHPHLSDTIPFDEAIHVVPIEDQMSESSHEERKRLLHEALNRLPVEFRDVLVLHSIEGWSYKRMATALNVPVGTIMSRLNRARRRLLNELAATRDPEMQNEL